MRTALMSLLALGLALSPAAAQAAGVAVNYNIDVGPLTVTVLKLNIDATGDEATARARIRSNGVSRMFSEFAATAEAQARLAGAGAEPVSYRIVREDSDERKETTVSWQGGTPSYQPPIRNQGRRERIDKAIAEGVTDPVTALLQMGSDGKEPCPATHRIFDGREVFELAFTSKGKGRLDGDAAWQGEVQRCEVEWTPIAGRAKDKGVPGDSYQVAFAAVTKLASGRTLWLPVAVSGQLKGLGFKAYATKVDPR